MGKVQVKIQWECHRSISRQLQILKFSVQTIVHEHGSGSIPLWGCFAAGGALRLQKVDENMKEEGFLQILQLHN